jgi:protein arginine N-methyltransferase 5
LSPECLDGCQHVIKPDGISIPSSYTSFIAPISSSKLFGDIIQYNDKLKHLETPYVVKFRKIHEIANPQQVWKFEHPFNGEMENRGSLNFNNHNNRYSVSTFTTDLDSVVHGLAGYFECTLYKSIIMSILPSTHSINMVSWFPLFFPLPTPAYLEASGSLEVHLWRCGDSRKVWYEWMVLPISPNGTHIVGGGAVINNPDGRSSWIGL